MGINCTNRNLRIFQLYDFVQQRIRRQNHSVSNQAEHLVAQYPRRNQMKNRFSAIANQRVTSVVPALKAHHGVGPFGQQIHDLALTLVPPLGTEYNHVAAHCSSSVGAVLRG